MPLVRKLAFGFRQHLPTVDGDRKFTTAGLHDLTGHADPVTQAQAGERVEVRSLIRTRKQLHTTGGIGEHPEGQLALFAAQHEPASDGHDGAGFGAVFDLAELVDNRLVRRITLEAVRDDVCSGRYRSHSGICFVFTVVGVRA